MYEAYIRSKISEFWDKFVNQKAPEARNGVYKILSLPNDEMRKILRGKTRELPRNCYDSGYEKDEFVILTNELNLPRCIVQITAVKGDAAWIKTVFKG